MPVELEYNTRAIPLDKELPVELDKLQKEGWQLVAGAVPLGIYHLVRIKGQNNSMGGVTTMNIDDSKVFVIPAKAQQN